MQRTLLAALALWLAACGDAVRRRLPSHPGTGTPDTAPLDTAPLHTAPLHTAPLHTAPLHTAPLHTAPLHTAPLHTAPLETPGAPSPSATPEPERWSALKAKIRRTFPGVDHVSVPALAAELEAAAAPLLLDVRAEDEYRVSHLASAVRAEDLDAALSALAGSPLDRPVVVYCSVGYRSSRLASELKDAGYTNVRNLEGSIFEWANGGRALERDGAPARTVHPYDDDWGTLLRRELWAAPGER